MRVQEGRERTKPFNLAIMAKMRKADLIRAIQGSEGNPQCFGAEWRLDCPLLDCCWRGDCLTKNPD